VKVQIDLGDTELKVTVDDDGKGFDPDNTAEKTGMGLKLIRDRVEMLGGTMDIDSITGQGTRINFQVPVLELQKTV
jgi:two-component system, NarL family, sensor histidine kinase DegS